MIRWYRSPAMRDRPSRGRQSSATITRSHLWDAVWALMEKVDKEASK